MRLLAAIGTAGLVFGVTAPSAPIPAPTAPPAPAPDAGMHLGAVSLQSAGVMHFTPDGTLFLADSRGATVYAIDVAEALRDTATTGVEIKDVDGKIAAALGTTRADIRVADMVAHPQSQSLYFSLTRGRGDEARPVLVRVEKVSERVTVLPLESIRHARAELTDAPDVNARTSWGAPKRAMTITDIALVDGELVVAGLSNEEFASTLRRLPYPFDRSGTSRSATTVEMYHTSHDKYETASPIETFLPITLDGRASMLAGYGCSPIVTFGRDELRSHRHLRGRTVSELGGGNRPFDMISYKKADGKEYVLIANSHRTLTRFDPSEIAKVPAMTTSMKQAYEAGGVGYLSISSFGVLQLDNYNRANVVVLQRNADDGTLEVASRTTRWL